MPRRSRRPLLLILLPLALTLSACACDQAAPAPATARRPPAAPPPPPAVTRPATRPAAAARPRLLPDVRRVVIVSVDGLRPDLIHRAGAPHVLGLLDAGAFTLWARSADVPLTVPSHASMLTGVRPDRHGVRYNDELEQPPPAYPTLFEAARERGLTTAFVAGKLKLRVLAKPGTLSWEWVEDADAAAVAARAEQVVRDHRPDLLVVHLPDVDVAGHADGWGSPPQLEAVRSADAAVGRVLAAVDAAGLAGSTLVVLTADHGGAGRGHWTDAAGSTVPWVARGPGVRRGFDLTRLGGPPVAVEDTFATACLALGLPVHPDLDGRAVEEIVAPVPGRELLIDGPGGGTVNGD